MLDEPYRWLEAIRNRQDYIEDQLSGGSPVVGVRYDDGMLLLTIGAGQQKIFEVHDRIALAAIGPVADIERLRMMATDTASVQGFQSSVDDVTLHRLTNFILGPIIKQAFESIFGSAYIIKMLLAELGTSGRQNQFISLNYDGNVQANRRALAIAGSNEAEQAMQRYLSATTPELSLSAALKLALETWAVGKQATSRAEEDEPEDDEVWDASKVDTDALRDVVAKALQRGEAEAGVLQTSRQGRSKFRPVTLEEINVAISGWIA